LVEDHAATRQTLQHLLRNRDYKVTSTETAGEAQQLALTGEFDLIISDLGLPDRTGNELMAELRSRNITMPGIALSGYGMEDDLSRSRAAGFAVHLVKPVTIGMLEDAIARLRPAQEPDTASRAS
jgi:CheY-like chemotaxis protein